MSCDRLLALLMSLAFPACFGPIEPTHPLDEDTSIEAQAKASLKITVSLPVVDELSGYLSLKVSHSSSDLRRMYLEDFTFEGNVTYSSGQRRLLYSHEEDGLTPGVYALFSFVPSLQLQDSPLFELDPGAELSLELNLEPAL